MKKFFVAFAFLLSLVTVSLCAPPKASQIHLAFSGKPSEMVVTWISSDPTPSPMCRYGYSRAAMTQERTGSSKRYFAGTYSAIVHEVVLTDLKPDTQVHYSCGYKDNEQSWSAVYDFTSMPTSPRPFRFISFGDFDLTRNSYETARRLTEQRQFDFIIHQGDIPYAWTEDRWDTWGNLIEPVAARYAYMVAPGNHEDGYKFSSYLNRFSSIVGNNSGTNTTLYYSFTYSWVQFIALSSEHDYTPGSPQYTWFEKTLRSVDRKKTPFIIVYAHRPMYSSNVNHGSDKRFRDNIEPLLHRYKVDMMLFGHVHAYERTCPVYKGVCIIGDQRDDSYYIDPKSTIHVIAGTAGYELNPDWERKPVWSDYRETNHGFLIVDVIDALTISVEFHRNEGSVGDRFVIQRTAPAVPSRY